jgi:PGF-pre-PGF domain-containing protein
MIYLASIFPVSADVDPGGLEGYNFCGGDPCPIWVNLTRGDMFFTNGNSIYIIANISCASPPGENICNASATVDANFSQIGGNELRGGVFKQNGTDASWAIFEFNDTVNFSSLSIQQIQPKNITLNATIFNATADEYQTYDLPSFVATVLLVNASTFGCPPADQNPPFPVVPGYNVSNLSQIFNPVQAVGCTQNATLCQYMDIYGPGTWNGTNWLVCAPNFGGATTNFNTIASTGNFSAIPNFTIEVPGKAKIVFQTDVSFDNQQKSQAIMEFAMKSAMGGGRIGINDTEYGNASNPNKPNLNLTARLTIYNISAQTGITGKPQLVRMNYDGSNPQSCPPSICSNIVWDGQNITFTVSSFSSYQVTDAINVSLNTPYDDNWINNRTINFTYTPVWNSSITMSNCTLFGNFSGSWGENATNSTILVNGTLNGIVNNVNLEGVYIWNIECYDISGLGDTGVSNYTVKVNITNPGWYTNQSSTPTNYSSTASQFNITWNDTLSPISVVLITIMNSTNSSDIRVNNASMTNSYGGSIYNYSIILPAGTWNWTSYANDTSNNWNATDAWTFTINKAATLATLYLNGTIANITSTYPNSTINVTAVANITGANVTIWRNGTSLVSALSTATDIRQWGAYNNYFNASVIADQNYSASSVVFLWLNVSKGTPTGSISGINVTLPSTTSITPSESNVGDADVNYTFWRDTSLVSLANGTTSLSADTTPSTAGTYTYKLNSTAGENWTANSSISTLVITVSAASSTTGGSSISGITTTGMVTYINLAVGKANITANYITTSGKLIANIAKYQDVAIRGLNITVVNNVANIKIMILKLPSLPSNVPYDVNGRVYNYISVGEQNFTDADIKSVNITFAVNKTWLTNNNVSALNITMYRWANNKWNDLNAVKVSDDDKEVFYKVSSPGLSVLIIGTKGGAPAVTETPAACTESWTCTDWSACANSQQTRTCTDANSCGTTASKPSESQSCTVNKGETTVTTPVQTSILTTVIVIVVAIIACVFIFLQRTKISYYLVKISKKTNNHKKTSYLESLARKTNNVEEEEEEKFTDI